ncbi:unnamed protein product [marine sediment metagenome]|uniref:Uncharacterized protein n=1 Tax=marine sediment metagenome TaxID=412755 RepID=X1AAZ0_9ZZZZ
MRIILSYTINFDLEALKDTEEVYEKVILTVEQSKIIHNISRFISQIIKLSDTTIKAITWNAIREWQIRNNKTIAEIRELPIGKRLNAIKEIFCIGDRMLKTMLKQPKNKSEIIIDIAFEKAFKLFLNYISKNNFER